MSIKTSGTPHITLMTRNGLLRTYNEEITTNMSDEKIKKIVATKTRHEVAHCCQIGPRGLKDIEVWLAASGLKFSENNAVKPDKKAKVPEMTLRDYFAAAALTGVTAKGYDSSSYHHAVMYCYQLADAMIERREK